jgi:hypothetical protein
LTLEEPFRQPAGQGSCREAAVMSRCDGGAHRLNLLLHQSVDFLQGLLVNRAPDKFIGADDDEGS